jgi:hypothetical protein
LYERFDFHGPRRKILKWLISNKQPIYRITGTEGEDGVTFLMRCVKVRHLGAFLWWMLGRGLERYALNEACQSETLPGLVD